MVDKKYLFEKLISYCKDIRGVDEQVLNAHLHQHGLTLRPDHRSFLLQYGNSSELLKFWFGDCTYSLFEQYTSDTQEYLSGFEEVPEGTVFFGLEFTEGVMCIDNQSGKIYDFEAKEFYDCVYESIDVLLFFCLVECLRNKGAISVLQQVIWTDDEAEQFQQENGAYYLANLDNFFTKYFLKNNQLIYCRMSSNGGYVVEYLQGEVLDMIAHGA